MKTTTLFPDAVITGELLEHLRLPNVPRYELVAGKIEPLTPTTWLHAEATVTLAAVLRTSMPGWRILAGDPGVYVARQPDTVRGPDVVAISETRYQERDPARAFLTVVPELVVEIISPSNEEEDLKRKVAEYLSADPTTTVWVVNVDERSITRCVGDGTCITVRIGHRLSLPNGVTVPVSEMFGAKE
jgi:Uma2 family endonuclease